MSKKEFIIIALDLEHEIFLVHVASFSSIALPSFSPPNVYSSHKAQMASLIAQETFTKMPAKYLDFADVFLTNLMSKLFD